MNVAVPKLSRVVLVASSVVAFAAVGCGGTIDDNVVVECGDGGQAVVTTPPDGGACAPGSALENGTCVEVAGTLSGLRWELPCQDPHMNPKGCYTASSPVVTTATAGGTSGVVYDVVLHFRGVIEERTYTGGTESGYFYTGGDTPDRSDPYNVYSLAISSPAQSYYVNAGTSDNAYCDSVDYTETVQIAAGATVTLTADAVEGTETINVDENGNAIVVPGIPPAPDAFDGQFLQMDVESVTPH